MINHHRKFTWDIWEYAFIHKLINLPHIEEIWLYGSRARGDCKDLSDIDMALLCPQASREDWARVMRIIEEADTLLKIDCLRYDELDQENKLKENIFKHKKIVYQKKTGYMEKEFWRDYFESLGDAISRLEEVVIHPELASLEILQDAALQRFEFTIELYWKVLKKFLAYEKIEATTPRDVLSKAFQYRLIEEEDIWLRMLDDRNKTSHIYKREEAKKVFENIKTYLPILKQSYGKLQLKF